MNPFTLIILRALLREPDTKAIALAWLETEPDRAKRARAFGIDLANDFEQRFTWAGEDAELIQGILQEALNRTDWVRVAVELLDRFTPKLLAGYVSTPSIN